MRALDAMKKKGSARRFNPDSLGGSAVGRCGALCWQSKHAWLDESCSYVQLRYVVRVLGDSGPLSVFLGQDQLTGIPVSPKARG